MLKLIKISFIINLIIVQIAFADICDFEFSGDPWLMGDLSDLENISNVFPDTIMDNERNGIKVITITHWLGNNCFKKEKRQFDSLGNIVISYSYIEKDDYKLQIAEGSIVRNVIYGDTPCNFTLVNPSSGNSMAFHFDGTESINSIKCEDIAKNLSTQVCITLIETLVNRCRGYKDYLEYIEDCLKCWENLSECLEKNRKHV
jgi:uncharacterized protein YkuJ